MRFAVFASGFGSNLQAIVNACQKKKINAVPALVVSDKKGAYALKRAQKAGIPTLVLDPKAFKNKNAYERALLQELRRQKIDFIALAGFMRILGPAFVKAYRNKILNIHPALLPAFKGAHAIEDAFDFGVRQSGVTVHFVDERVDNGPVILQEPVEIKAKDTLQTFEKKIHAVEHKLYPSAIALFAQKRLKVKGRKVIIR